MSDDVQWCVRVVEQGHVEDTAILSDEVFEVDPVVVDGFVNDVDLALQVLVIGVGLEVNLLLKFAQIGKDVHERLSLRELWIYKLIVLFVLAAHEVSMHLDFCCQMAFESFAVQTYIL